MKKLVLILIAITIIWGCFAGCSSKGATVDVKLLADIQLSGMSSKATALVNIDAASMAAVVNSFKETTNDTQKILEFEKALKSIRFEISSGKTDNLSNGDELTIKTFYNETLINDAGIKFENIEFTYSISGLPEGKPLDLFTEIELVYDGASPTASVEIYNRSEQQFIREIRYTVKPSRNLRIGDKFVVTAELNMKYAESSGYLVPDNLTKEYTVENIDEYVTDFNDITQSIKNKIEDEAAARIAQDLADRYGFIIKNLDLYDIFEHKIDDTRFDEPELTNIYFATIKPGVSSETINNIFYFYKITAYYKQETEPRIVYLSMRFRNAVKKADGSIELNTDVSNTSSYSEGPIYAISKNKDLVFSDTITSQKDNYEIQEIFQ